MNFYLSSYKLGIQSAVLPALNPTNLPIAYIPNAMDFVGVNLERRATDLAADIAALTAAGLTIEPLDLKDYFGNPQALAAKLQTLGGLFIRGGNVFVLRQAMKLSGLDAWVLANLNRPNFLYAGYSAACCILSPSLEAYSIVDDPNNFPYPELQQTLWDGLGVLSYAFLPHFHSNHHESEAIELELKRCIEQKMLFKAYRDGEVELLEYRDGVLTAAEL